MNRFLPIALLIMAFSSFANAAELGASEIIQRVLASDPWGLGGAEVVARLIVSDKAGSKRELVFSGKSVQYDPPLAKSVVRFSAPAELAGAAFLQVQKKDGDDDRFLFLPELKRSRRISGSLRAGAFMGTDFSFADLDRRDLRNSNTTSKGKETIGKYSCYVVDISPKSGDSEYSHVEMWVREDNFLPLRMKMYDRGGQLLKTYEATETKRVSGAWFISKSRMFNHRQNHSTILSLDQIAVKTTIPEDEFSVRALERP